MLAQTHIAKFLNRFDETKRQKMLDVYITSLETHAQASRQALEMLDAARLKAAAHDLKSLSYTLEANEEGDLAKEIEYAIIDGNTDAAFAKAPELIAFVERMLDAMKTYQAG